MSERHSHSAVSKYQSCPREYYFHYKERLRETTTSGALLFGSAIDLAFNELLLPEGKETAEDIFTSKFAVAKVGTEIEEVPTCERVVYSASDFDGDLLSKEDLEVLIKRNNNPDPIAAMKTIANMKAGMGWDGLHPSQRQFYNLGNWLCLRQKGLLMIREYREKILPLIDEVLFVQKKVSLKNNDGDEIIGYTDFAARLKDGRTVIFDNKTSSIEYDHDAVVKSPQLILYVHALGDSLNTRTAGFIVLRKGIIKNKSKVCTQCFYKAEKGSRHKTCSQVYNNKRCEGAWDETIDPEVAIQVLIDEIPERAENMVLQNYDEINTLIKSGIFTRNFNSCVKPWGKCAYADLCWNGKTDGLVKVEEGK